MTISTVDPDQRRPSISTAELRPVGERLGRLALARHEQAGKLSARQQEELRRTLHEAARCLNWDVRSDPQEEHVPECLIDVQRLTQAGMRGIERDLDSEISDKRYEIRRLKQVVRALSVLAGEGAAAFPAEVAYYCTAAQGKDGYVTKEEVLVLEDPASAGDAADQLEKRLDRLRGLRDDMTHVLKQRKRTVRAAAAEIVDFVHGASRLVAEVVAILV